MAKPPRTVFVCQECGAQAPKWLGRCADCGAVGCVTWGHQYQPLVCQAESRPASTGRPELRAIEWLTPAATVATPLNPGTRAGVE